MKHNILEFNNYCKENQWNLQEALADILKNSMNPILTECVSEILYNQSADILIPVLEDIYPYIENIKLQDEEIPCDYLSEDDTNLESIVDLINEKYGTRVDIAQGDARIALIFDEFVIKFDKSYYSSQTEDEIAEYYSTIIAALDKKTHHIHDLLPMISIINVENIDFEIFPKALALESSDYQIDRMWLDKQSRLRMNILGEGINNHNNDLIGDNLGYYNNKLYIIDAGSISDLNS